VIKKLVLWVVVLAALGGAIFAFVRWRASRAEPEVQYRTAAVETRGIVSRVTASGTLQATVTVQVGTQVSGRVQRIHVDFNAPVKKGQPVAKIDPQLFQAAVAAARANHSSARANVVRSEAQVLEADRQFARLKKLSAEGLASTAELNVAETNLTVAKAAVDVAKAAVEQSAAALNQAQVNLSYTDIVSPIDGTVISRNVDVGQTVAASLQAPVLFTIAEDLRNMQVNANVSEGDVGRLTQGMEASFTVDAFPGQKFFGKIAQIRNAAQTVQNVVTYNAVVDVANPDLKLRPGMTANVTMVYAEKNGVLAIPNAALRFRPSPDARGGASATAGGAGGRSGAGGGGAGGGGASEQRTVGGDGGRRAGRPDGGRPDGGRPDGEAAARPVFRLDGTAATPVMVVTGLSDGSWTEIVSGDLKEGDAIILDATTPGKPGTGGAPPGGTGSLRRVF